MAQRSSIRGLVCAVALAVAGVFASADGACAQDTVYGPEEVQVPPKVASPGEVADMVRRSYPPMLQERGLGGSVQIQVVVGADGKVEAESVKVLAATVAVLGDAAKKVASRIPFTPATKDGQPVRCRVIIPITYRAN